MSRSLRSRPIEYNALRRRHEAVAATDSTPPENAEPDGDKSPSSATAEFNPPTLDVNNAGYFFETFEVQVLTLSLIAFDVAAAVTSMLLTCNGYPESPLLRAMLNMIEVRGMAEGLLSLASKAAVVTS